MYDQTQRQADQDQRRAAELSLQRTRPPAEVPGYEPRRFLGAGAYGEVWVAVDQNTGRQVAIKFYTHRGGLDWSLLSREVEKLVFLSTDRYVVQLLDVGWEAEPPYYVMEYIENGSLDDRLRERGPMGVNEAVELLRDVATGLAHAHAKGVLHCDLKPANILLDQDNRTRLADFGQSRLSHEQSPALGTLFYMAPEQADMEAVPDAQWDVYALGAVIYTALTGSPPHRTEDATHALDTASDLGDLLARYRKLLRTAKPPTGHRQVKGIDSGLVEIIDRCLAVDPTQRYASVQSVLDALRRREEIRAARPLLIMGFLAPALLLLIVSLFGLRAYYAALTDSERAVAERAMETNRFAAQFVANLVSQELQNLFRVAEEVASDDAFQELMIETLADPELARLHRELSDPRLTPPRRAELRKEFEANPERRRLQEFVDGWIANPQLPRVASWLVNSSDGLQVANAFPDQPDASPLGINFAWRTYFHGGPADLPPETRSPNVKPTEKTYLSAVFKSTATNTWKVAISTPIVRGGETIGVLAMTVNLGEIMQFEGTDSQIAVLVDGRAGDHRGVVLQHPLLDEGSAGLTSDVDDYKLVPPAGVDWETFLSEARYDDPLGKAPGGEKYDKHWIASGAHVEMFQRAHANVNGGAGNSGGARAPIDTGLVVFVQQDYNTVTQAVYQLGSRLFREAMIGLGVLLGVVTILWYFVTRMIGDPTRTRPLPAPQATATTRVADMQTLPAPRARAATKKKSE